MSDKVGEAAIVLAPVGTGSRLGARVDGTGTTEAHNATALTKGAYATIVSDTALFAVFRGTAGLTTQVTASSAFIIPANTFFSWLVEEGSRYIYMEAKDGSSAWDAYVWTSGQGIG